MTRKLLSALLTLLLAALPAPAENAPVFSEDVQLIQTANAALYERYALTAHCLGLFDTAVTHYGDTALVRYTPGSSLHPALTGEYAVLITPEGTQALWTHDDVDPAVWQSGELNSIAWGAPQLTAYLLQSPFDRDFFDEPYRPTELPDTEYPRDFIEQGGHIHRFDPGFDLELEDVAAVHALALSAAKEMYNLTDDALAELLVIQSETRLYVYPDGHGEWYVVLYHDTQPDEINYFVRIDRDTNVILTIHSITGGLG